MHAFIESDRVGLRHVAGTQSLRTKQIVATQIVCQICIQIVSVLALVCCFNALLFFRRLVAQHLHDGVFVGAEAGDRLTECVCVGERLVA